VERREPPLDVVEGLSQGPEGGRGGLAGIEVAEARLRSALELPEHAEHRRGGKQLGILQEVSVRIREDDPAPEAREERVERVPALFRNPAAAEGQVRGRDPAVHGVALVIEEAIVSGELAPGTVLRQEQLSEQFNVSRTPVREALRRLAALGVVSFVPNRGVRVRTISRDELHEAFMVRAELESLATEVAATKITPEELDELDRVEQSFSKISQELRSREPGDERRSIMGDWVRGNHAFHDIIYRVADLPLVEQMAKSARRTFSGPAVWAPGDHSIDGLYLKNAEQHRAIKQALAAGSAAGARALAREHVLSSFTLLETILEQVGAQPRDWQRARGKSHTH